jgi:hypothetical protein
VVAAVFGDHLYHGWEANHGDQSKGACSLGQLAPLCEVCSARCV